MRTLLHVCCAPCALGVIDNVKEGNDITLYF
ncbi:MAG: epoxyqueuosine reductase QueH [Clostridia bacterium]|nr:epoxyqueuosine reductase QueH [Clostridia bacterium]